MMMVLTKNTPGSLRRFSNKKPLPQSFNRISIDANNIILDMIFIVHLSSNGYPFSALYLIGISFLFFLFLQGAEMKKYGLTGIGAIPYMTNFNVTLKDGINLDIGRKVAAKIRNSNPDGTGCLGVQSMAFNHIENRIEIACNVELLEYDSSNFRHVEVYTYQICRG